MIGDVPKPRYPHLHQETHRKVVYWYFREGHGKRIRLRGEYGSPEFMEAYRAALTGEASPGKKEPAARANTVAWLIARYQDSGAWTAFSEATRRQQANILKGVIATAGRNSITSLTKSAVAKGMDRRAKTPAAANNFLKTMRSMFRWAIGAGIVASDPTEGVAKIVYKSDGHAPWTDSDIEAFEARWTLGTRERLALAVFLYTGLRRGDAAVLGRQHFKDGMIELRTEKTGEEVFIPVLPEFQEIIDASPCGTLTLIATASGLNMAKESLGNWFGEACRAAGISGKSAHGLRKYAATFLAERGFTEAQLESIFGWRGGRMAARYTDKANRRRLAKEAMAKLLSERGQNGNVYSRTPDPVREQSKKHQ